MFQIRKSAPVTQAQLRSGRQPQRPRCRDCRVGWVRPNEVRDGRCWGCQDKQRIADEVGQFLANAVAAAQFAEEQRERDAVYDRAMAALLKPRGLVAARRMPEMERRTVAFDARAEGGDGLTLTGYAAVFRSPTTIRDVQGEFEEVMLPGAFTRSLKERTPLLMWDHGKDPRVGTAPIGDITTLREDDRGLFVRARLYDDPDTVRIRRAIAGGSIKGMSFRFGVPDGGDVWTRRTGKPDLREVRDADVHELGPVAFPAYVGTSVAVRAA